MGEPSAGVEVDLLEGLTVVRPWGALDITGAALIRPQLEQALNGSSRLFLIDMGRVHFLDGSGLKEIMRARDLIRSRGGQMSVINGKPHIRRLLDVVGRVGARLPQWSLHALAARRADAQ